MNGHSGELIIEPEQKLKTFKENLKDILEEEHDDRILLRFLRARSFDLKKAEDMFRRHVVWRKRYPVKYAIEEYEPKEVLQKYIQVPFLGFDKEGSPIRLIFGSYDLRGMMCCCKPEDITQYAVHVFEGDLAESDKKFNNRTIVLIFDLVDTKLAPLCNKLVFDTLTSILRDYEKNYPETLKRVFVINTPYFINWLLNVVKAIAAEETMKKLRIFGSDGYQKEMIDLIGEDVLPERYGGKRKDLDSMDTPQMIPESYFLRNQGKLKKDTFNVNQCFLRRRSKQELPMFIDDIGSTIVWQVECPNQDINVGLFYKNRDGAKNEYGESQLEELVPYSRAGGNYGPLGGSYVTKKSGVYVLVFDNTFSMLRSKYVLYTVNILPPVSKVTKGNQDDIIR